MADRSLAGDPSGLFDGKSVLVVGASRGIGAPTARLFARAGAWVTLVSRDRDALERLADELRGEGGRAQAKAADMGSPSDMEAAVAFASEPCGGLDVAVNNAAIALPQVRIAETDLADFDRLMAVNLRGVFIAMQHELRAMQGRGRGGAIVNVSSVGGLIGSTGRASYVSSKHGLGGLTKSAALEYAAEGIRVNAVAPGVTMTDLIKPGLAANPDLYEKLIAAVPLGRCAQPEEIANAIVWLASDLASFVTGVVMPVDGGFTVP